MKDIISIEWIKEIIEKAKKLSIYFSNHQVILAALRRLQKEKYGKEIAKDGLKLKYFRFAEIPKPIMHLILAGIIEFPKIEIDVIQDSIIDFSGTAIAKYRNEKFQISDSEFQILDFCQINFGAILKNRIDFTLRYTMGSLYSCINQLFFTKSAIRSTIAEDHFNLDDRMKSLISKVEKFGTNQWQNFLYNPVVIVAYKLDPRYRDSRLNAHIFDPIIEKKILSLVREEYKNNIVLTEFAKYVGKTGSFAHSHL
ncbi:hypothetical protein RhiirC2_794377 [Rhizophagus irregularis]|uniref:Uncharacterized protein n=1 Tax=Rhizophagus irregularis TaxID=588596 RepID=A0A2N1MDM8_9GLOM|nr:hypothetical protein RhiirC2_794377 [Rhizophagus irregularis]